MNRFRTALVVLSAGLAALSMGCLKSSSPPAPPSATGTPVADSTPIATQQDGSTMSVQQQSFGQTSDGQDVSLFTCTNRKGVVLKMTNYGGTIVALETPDKEGKRANINLGFDSLADYEKHTAFFGCTVGRYGNRIAKGKFTLDGKEYTLATNNGPNHLHGGSERL